MNVSGILPSYASLETAYLLFYAFSCLLSLILLKNIFSRYLSLKQKSVLVEVKPTARSTKSSLSTTELFKALHNLCKPHTFWHAWLGVKNKITFELVSTKNDGIRYLLYVPIHDLSSVRKTLLAYLPGIEIKVTPEYVPKTNLKSILVREYKQAKSFIYPLHEQTLLDQHDPLSYLTAQMTKLKQEEVIALQIITTPIYESTHSNVSEFVHKVNRLLIQNQDLSKTLNSNKFKKITHFFSFLIVFLLITPFSLLAWLLDKNAEPLPFWIFTENKRKDSKPIGRTNTELHASISNKLAQPQFQSTMRVFITSTESTSAKEKLKGFTSSIASFSNTHQSLVLKLALLDITKLKLLKDIYYYQFRNRLHSLSSSSILSTSELAGIYHFPFGQSTKTEDLIQVKSPNLPAPLSLKKDVPQLDLIFAQNTYGETTIPIGLTLEERRRHAYIVGATGTGKTTLLQHMIYQDLQKGNGLAVIDPHGDLTEKLLGLVPKNRIKDVVFFNPYDIELPIGLNVLEIPKGLSNVELQREKDFITSTLISIFHKLYDARFFGPRMEHILRNVVLTALEQDTPTLFTIYQLLTDKDYRQKAIKALDDEVLTTFWKNEFEKMGSFQKAEMISPITNKLGRFLTTGMTRNILNQPTSKLDFDDIMNNRKILICNLSKGKIGEDTAYFLGSLLTAKIQLTALRRVHLPETKRKDFYLYIDEFQNFATLSFGQILSEARKYRLSVVLAHQNTIQIESELLETIIGNSGTLISFRTTSPLDERKLLPIFTPEVEKGQIANLPSYHFYIKINALQPQSTFSGEIEDFMEKNSDDIKNKVITHSRNTFGMAITSNKKKTQKKVIQIPVKEKRLSASINNLLEAI